MLGFLDDILLNLRQYHNVHIEQDKICTQTHNNHRLDQFGTQNSTRPPQIFMTGQLNLGVFVELARLVVLGIP